MFAPAARAAGPKSNGSIVVVDDALGGTAGSASVSAGPVSVVGGLATPVGGRVVSIRDSLVDGGFFSFPFPFSRLLLLAPGEGALAGGFPGKTGQPAAHVKGSTFTVTVYATDWFFQPVADAPGHSVRLSTIAAGETQPPAQTLAQGATTFSGLAVVSTTGTFVLFARDQTDPTIGVSASTLTFALPATSSPTVHANVAQNASYATLGGGIYGTAFDPSGVQRVQLAVRRVDTSLYYDKPARSFSLPAQTFVDAGLGLRGAVSTTWFYTLPDGDLVDGARYAVELVAENPSGLRVPAVSTFTFDARGIAFAPDDGRATAFAVPVSSAGCEALTATVTVVLGGAGIRPGGLIALRLPSGWTRPAGLTVGAPSTLGEVTIVSTAPAFSAGGATTTLLNPASFAGAPLGDGWIVVAVSTGASAGIEPGQQVAFSARARPPIGPQGRGAQRFELRTQAFSTGTLTAIAEPPTIDLTTGAVVALSFRDPAPIALGPLQTSPTMHLETVDLCGNPAPPPAGLTVTLEAGSIAASGAFAVDASAAFFAEQTGAALTQRFVFPPNSRPADPGGFYFRTGQAGPRAHFVRLTGSTIISDGYRFVDLRASTVSISGVSIDTGTLSPQTTSVVLSSGSAAFVRFTVADPLVAWEVLVATETGFASPLFRASGQGSPTPQSVSWPGVDARLDPPRSAGPGLYHAAVRAGGGTAVSAGLSARVQNSAFVFGSVGVAGAGALVRALGRGASPGTFAVASSTGYFEVYGLTHAEAYEVRASTRVPVLGQPVELATATAAGIVASTAGASAGPLAFGVPSAFRVSVALPEPAPSELVGRVAVHDEGFALLASGSLHFSSGAARSDSGGHAFGQSAGTWTVVALPAGTYDLDVAIPQVGLSTVVAGRVLAPGQVSDLQLFFGRKANVHGWTILPTTKTFGAWVSVHAAREGSGGPSVYGGTFAAGEPTARSSVPYSLFGLDPGTWTIVARSQGFVSTAATVVIVSTVDATGVDLRLGLGGVIAGTVTVLGDTGGARCRTSLPGGCPASGLVLFVQAYNLSTFASNVTPLRLSTNATVASATFSLTGLESGPHLVRAFLPHFQLDPAGGVELTVSTPAVAVASVTLRADDARLRLDVRLPPLSGGACYPAADFRRIGFSLDLRPQGALAAGGDLTSLAPPATTALHCSSMTFVSPPLGPGTRRVWLVSGSSGSASALTASLAHGSTATYAADLNSAVFTVTGTVTFSGTLTFGGAGGAVTVSSASALAALAPTTSYCLLTATAPVRLSSARVELVGVDPDGDTPGPLLTAASAGGDCRAFEVPGTRLPNGVPDPGFRSPALLAYVGALRPDGSFAISSVPAGSYWLRNVADLDLDPSNGLEAAEHRRLVRISTGGSVGAVLLSPGAALRGTLTGPVGLTRPVRVSLTTADGRAKAALDVRLDGSGARAFAFPRLAAGRYVLQALDLGFPRAYAAAPRVVDMPSSELVGQDLRLVSGGTIRLRLAVETVKSDGSREYVLVTGANPELLPAGLRVYAVASPTFQGGFFTARGRNCGDTGACRDVALDSNGQVVIENVLPGVYDVEFAAPTEALALEEGGTALTSSVRAGVRVAEGETVDLGAIPLPAGAVLTGRSTDSSSGAPVPNLRVRATPTLRRPGDESLRRLPVETFTDAGGRYALTGLDPAARYYDVVAGARGVEPTGTAVSPYEQRFALTVDLRSTSTLDFSMQFASYSVVGRVSPGAGLVLATAVGDGERAGASVFLQKAGLAPFRDPIADIQAITDGQGSFAIPSLTTGTYRLSVAALGFAVLERTVDIRTGSVDVGTLTLGSGASLTGALRLPDGSAPGEDDVATVVAVTPDLSEYLPGAMTRDRVLRAVTGYRITGFQPGRLYRVLIADSRGARVAPAEGAGLVFASTAEARHLDLVYRPEPPRVLATSRRSSGVFGLNIAFSQPLRARRPEDDELQSIVSTVSARGTLGAVTISEDRMRLFLSYTPGQVSPGVLESSFTLRVRARTAVRDPAASGPDPEYVAASTFTVFVGVDALRRVTVNNFQGGVLALEGDGGRVTLPKGAFAVDASSSVDLAFLRSTEQLAVAGVRTAAANLASLRFPPPAYPPELIGALAATPPQAAPAGPFYDIELPPGSRTALAKPVELCVTYAAGSDPSSLNLYWYNPAANTYVLQQDVLGAEPRVDAATRAKCQNVDHLSTFVLFNTGVAVISGNSFGGDTIEAVAFPNPFDLAVKQVTPIHGAPIQSVRGTMVRLAVPPSISGAAKLEVFTVAGQRVRTIDLGVLAGGAHYYQPFDGRNDAGRDLASGVYVGQVRIGGRSASFKMGVLK